MRSFSTFRTNYLWEQDTRFGGPLIVTALVILISLALIQAVCALQCFPGVRALSDVWPGFMNQPADAVAAASPAMDLAVLKMLCVIHS